MTKEYITKRLSEGATVEEIAAEFSATLNEVQKEQEEKNAQLTDLRAIVDQFINYLNLYHNAEAEYLTDEELTKLKDIIPSIIKLAESMERLNSLTIKTFENIGNNDTTVTYIESKKGTKPKTEDLPEVLVNAPDSVIDRYVNTLLGL